MNDEAVYRTAPATPGLLIISKSKYASLNWRAKYVLAKYWNLSKMIKQGGSQDL